jgi:hypothetical protein
VIDNGERTNEFNEKGITDWNADRATVDLPGLMCHTEKPLKGPIRLYSISSKVYL